MHFNSMKTILLALFSAALAQGWVPPNILEGYKPQQINSLYALGKNIIHERDGAHINPGTATLKTEHGSWVTLDRLNPKSEALTVAPDDTKIKVSNTYSNDYLPGHAFVKSGAGYYDEYFHLQMPKNIKAVQKEANEAAIKRAVEKRKRFSSGPATRS